MIDAETLARLEAVKQAFLADLPQRRSRLEADWAQLLQATDAAAVYTGFYREVHSLSGAAGTFGFEELSRLARTLELELTDHADRGTLEHALQQPALAQTYGQVMHAIDAVLED